VVGFNTTLAYLQAIPWREYRIIQDNRFQVNQECHSRCIWECLGLEDLKLLNQEL
jgi:hypothetical protein